MDQKEQRNKRIISMHNEGKTVREIAEASGVSKTLVNNVINSYIESLKGKPVGSGPAVTENKPEPKQTVPASTVTGSGKRITSFGDLQYTGNPNEYANKQTGEIIKVKFVPAKTPGTCGHFETV